MAFVGSPLSVATNLNDFGLRPTVETPMTPYGMIVSENEKSVIDNFNPSSVSESCNGTSFMQSS